MLFRSDRTPPRLLRPGAVGRAALEAVLGPIAIGADVDSPRVPGSTPQHYAPLTPVVLATDAEIAAACVAARHSSARLAVLARSAAPSECAALESQGRWLRAPADAVAYGRLLYAALRTLDKLEAERILVERAPEDPAWDAVRDRLERAAAAG